MKGIVSYGLFSDISQAVNRLTSPAVVATATKFCHDGIQKARQLDAGDVKDAIKNQFSTVAAGAIGIGGSLLSFLGTMLTSSVWSNLNYKQRIGIALTFVVGTGLSIYSLTRFGMEKNTASAGYSAASGILFINSAEFAARKFAEKEIAELGDITDPHLEGHYSRQNI